MESREIKSHAGEVKVEKIEDFDPDLDCNICMKAILPSVVHAPCGHAFCQSCVNGLFIPYKLKTPCPTCRKETYKSEFRSSTALNKALEKMSELKAQNQQLLSTHLNPNLLGKTAKYNFEQLFKLEIKILELNSRFRKEVFVLTAFKASLAFEHEKLTMLCEEKRKLEIEFKQSLKKARKTAFKALDDFSLLDAKHLGEIKETKTCMSQLREMHAALDSQLLNAAILVTQKDLERQKKIKKTARNFFWKATKTFIQQKHLNEAAAELSKFKAIKMEFYYAQARKEYAQLIAGSRFFSSGPEIKISPCISQADLDQYLLKAVQANNLKLARNYLANKADPNITSLADHKTPSEQPLITAVKFENDKMVTLLLENKANPNARNSQLIDIKSEDGHQYVRGPEFSHTALSFSVAMHGVFRTPGQLNILKSLLNANADISFRFKDNGQSLLHLAAQLQDKEVILELLACRADPTWVDKEGLTPLEHAKNKNGAVDEIENLLQKSPTVIPAKA